MRYLDEKDFKQFAANREQIKAETAEKLADPDLWKGVSGLHDLALLRLGWQMHVEECDRRMVEQARFLHDVMDSSWTEIGRGLGISKQAAQKRFAAK